DARCLETLALQRMHTSPTTRRRQGPITRQPSATEEIRLACVKGDHVVVQSLIENGRVNINSLLDDGWSPLMIAASAARPLVVDYLLSKDADPNLLRKDNFTALMAATGSSQLRTDDIVSCVTALMKAGSHVNAKDNNGMTPLGFAVKENRYEVANHLIDAGANLDSLDRNGRNCLFYAAEKGYGHMARLLLENGANIDIVDKSGWMICETAVEKGHFKLGELLFRVRESCWRPGRNPALMTEFNDVPEPLITDGGDTDTGEGIVNILTNIQTQVKCLSNTVNSVRIRMVQDVITKEYEVEPGKMDDLVVFARSMGKSCAILSNEVSSLNILVNGETKRGLNLNDSRKAISSPEYASDKVQRSRWDVLLAGAAGVMLLCYFLPHLRGKLATMRLWQL
ncbi:Ankyrin repeat, SAM and basic leucine zipper domain-containing protein 1, partial [Orchesella cincta]